MRMFVWEDECGVSDRYHDTGGVLVIANDLNRTRELLKNEDGVSKDSTVFTKEPDFSTSVGTTKEKVFIFPDAGCC